jgi:cytoskeleton protein RodZ
MATVGEQLRRRREQAKLTLSEVAARTRVPEWILAEVERDELTRVPGGIYIRGYITSFARVVGLDGEQLWANYCADSQPAPETAAPPPVTVPAVRRWSFVTAASVVAVVGVVAGLLRYNATRHHADANVVRASEPAPARVSEVPATDAPIAEPAVAVDAPAPEPPRRVAATRTRRRVSKPVAPVVATTNEEQAPPVAADVTDATPPAADAQ